MTGLSHFDDRGQAHMVDVSGKAVTDRVAVATGAVRMTAETLALVTEGRAKKGDVLAVARLAGIMAAKKTADLIPLCHPLPITKVALDLTPDPALPGVRIEATVKTFKRKDGKVWLLPHNADFSPIDGDHATILGKVTAVLRRI